MAREPSNGIACQPSVMASVFMALALAGCGHREVKTPCAPSDGASKISAFAPIMDDGWLALVLVQDREPEAGTGFGPVPIADPCGPLKPLTVPPGLLPPSGLLPRSGARP